MLPRKLNLYNFMSYGQAVPELNFGQFDLACLSGPNGVGKSTLLEAITWSLWGKSRAKSDDDLVHQGQEQMIVSFEFELEENLYKIVRKRSNKKRGIGQLEFYFFQNNEWQPMSGTNKSDTQKKIDETLHLDYETFTNSAFLRQGHADEFTVKRPQERKAILSEILGLRHYDELQKKVKEETKVKEIEKESLEKIVASFKEDIKDKDQFKKELKEKEKILTATEKEVEKKEKENVVLQEEKSFLENQKNYVENLTQKIEENKNEILSLEGEIKQMENIIILLREIISQKNEIEIGYKTLINLKKQDEELYQKFVLRQRLVEEKNILERKILMAQKDKENELAKILGQIEDRKKKLINKGIIAKIGKKIKVEVGILDEKEKEKEILEEKIQVFRQEQVSCAEKMRQIEENKIEIQENLNLLSKATAQCPLCEQVLTIKHKTDVGAKLKNKLQELIKKRDEQDQKRQNLTKESRNLNLTILTAKNLLKEKQIKTDLLAQKRQEYAQLLQFEKEIRRFERQKMDIENEINNKKINEELNTALKALENKLESLQYNEEIHREIKQKKNESEKYQKLKIQLEEAEKREKIEVKTLENKKSLMVRKRKVLEVDLAVQKKMTFNPQKLEKIKALFEKQSSELGDLRRTFMAIKEEFGVARERVSQIDSKEKEIKNKKEKLEKIKNEVLMFDEIAEALGKKGVQAMIIESVLPEIEEEANLLLSKMTEGKMSLKIFTQKEKKSDEGVQETLDIQIQDERGMRPYEMFSGGEAFRINFAIRIALSKLLARRANARLQFLVIDEGFGTQDVMGREYIIEAINTVRDSFKKILVITHIPELKEAFPSRIEVTKGVDGSRFEVIN